ncbi:MAG: tryptophan synthase subunit alpha [Marinilabiliales bacterium]|nr:tryptophan synthase subunit alpha [Marinilabiliales bacterium]
MNRISTIFNQPQRPLLSVYFTAGYPERDSTLSILKALEANGVDLCEIGIPFSDPMADGPVIQHSTGVALKNGMSLRLLFEQLKEVRKHVRMPLLLMGYLNPILSYGFEPFCQSCQACGIDGLIIPDLPFAEYRSEFQEVAIRHGLKMIMLITPETSEERIRLIDRHTEGFIYLVSSASTTGAKQQFDEGRQSYFKRVASMQLKNPLMVGFGISNKATFEAATAMTQGAIVGSKFIELQGQSNSPEEAIQLLLRLIER